MIEDGTRRRLAAVALLSAAVTGFVAFRVVTTRIALVDGAVGFVVGLRTLTALGGLLRPSARLVVPALTLAAALHTVLGTAVAAALLHSAGRVAGTYAGFGDAVAAGYVALVLLVVPWAVVFPALELWVLARRGSRAP